MAKKDKSGVVLTDEKLLNAMRDSSREARGALSEAYDANIEVKYGFATEPMNAAFNTLRQIDLIPKLTREVSITKDPQTQEYLDTLVADHKNYSEKAAKSSQVIEKEMQDVLALLPEKERAPFLAGFLKHHDIVRNVQGDGTVLYAPDFDKKSAARGQLRANRLAEQRPFKGTLISELWPICS